MRTDFQIKETSFCEVVRFSVDLKSASSNTQLFSKKKKKNSFIITLKLEKSVIKLK